MRHNSRSFSTEGIVLKRSKVGESDSVVTLLTRGHGKLVVIAKGARKLTSSRLALLEPGNYLRVSCAHASMPILTQAVILKNADNARSSLGKIRQLTQLLEILDRLFVEEEIDEVMFDHVLSLHKQVTTDRPVTSHFKTNLEDLIEMLGYQHPRETQFESILEYVATLVEKPMKSFEYLVVKK